MYTHNTNVLKFLMKFLKINKKLQEYFVRKLNVFVIYIVLQSYLNKIDFFTFLKTIIIEYTI